MQFFDNKGSNYNSEQNDVVFEADKNVANNKKNEEEYNKLMRESLPQHSDYYDKNNPVIKLILLILGIIIVVGTVYVIMRGTG